MIENPLNGRDDDNDVINMTTIMIKTVTVDAQPTAEALLMQANGASASKPIPAAKNGAPAGQGSPAGVVPPKSAATTKITSPCELAMLGLFAIHMICF